MWVAKEVREGNGIISLKEYHLFCLCVVWQTTTSFYSTYFWFFIFSEDSSVNRLHESINLFKQTAQNDVFKKSAFIIFFNKFDLFQQKFVNDKIGLNHSGLFNDAPLYDENDTDFISVKKWFKNQLVNSVEGFAQSRKYYHHYTTALDKKNMNFVIKKSTHHILMSNTSKYGISA